MLSKVIILNSILIKSVVFQRGRIQFSLRDFIFLSFTKHLFPNFCQCPQCVHLFCLNFGLFSAVFSRLYILFACIIFLPLCRYNARRVLLSSLSLLMPKNNIRANVSSNYTMLLNFNFVSLSLN